VVRTLPAQQLADAADCRIARVRRVARQHLVGVKGAGWVGSDDVGEGAAAVYGEAPAVAGMRSGHVINVARAGGDENCCAIPGPAWRYDGVGTN
jgi:hypothetical protein